MSRRRASMEPLAIVPAPAWMSELAGAAVSKAAAWPSGRSVCVRLATFEGSLSWELAGDDSLRAVRVDPGPPARREAIDLGGLTAEQRAQASRFVQRIRWLHGSGSYAPTPRETQIAELAGALSASRSEDVAGIRGDHAGLEAIAPYFDVLEARWDRVFGTIDDALGRGADAVDGSRGRVPLAGWLETVLEGLGGRVEALLARAGGAADERGAFAILSGMALELAGLREPALERYRAAIEGVVGVQRADLSVELSKLHRERGQLDDAVGWARRALLTRGDDDRLIRRASFELVRCGALDDAYAVLRDRCARPPVPPLIALGLAELLLWAGRADEAWRWLEPVLGGPVDGRVLRCVGVRHAIMHRHHEALEAFQRAHECAPGDMEIAAWLCETHLRLDEREAAEHFLVDSRTRVQTAIHTILAGALCEPEAIPYQSELRGLLDVLGEPLEPWLGDPGPVSAGLTMLTRFGGNRGEMPTRLTGSGELGIEVVRLPKHNSVLSSRDASADALKLVGTMPLDELEARFDRLAADFPESPHPLCYRGELDLWLGEYERAIDRFDAALSRGSARWAYVGKGAALILRGEYDAADEVIAECGRVFSPVRGATTHVYVGEALRRRGEPRRAIEELSEAVSAKPGRTGAWMNIALSHLALGEDDEARRIFHRLEARVPRLYWDAWRALDGAPRWPVPEERMGELFERALEMMRGNRSSHTLTYFDDAGVFRIARDARVWRTAMAKHASVLGAGLRSELASADDT